MSSGSGTTARRSPTRAGSYRIERLLGVGGMGEVYLGLHEDGSRAALKRLPPVAAEDAMLRRRFQREADAARQLDHPTVVRFYDLFATPEGDHWIAMEFAEGETLYERIATKGALGPARVHAVTRQIAEGLATAHAQGIVHRDLKTENVIVTPRDEVKILDFGLAKHLLIDHTTTLTRDGTMLGTCRTMSPEQALGEDVDARSDLFSLGVLMYEALTTVSPFMGSTPLQTVSHVVSRPVPPLAEQDPRIPAAMAELVERLVEKKPEARPQSAREVIEALDAMELPGGGWRGVVGWLRGRLGKG